MKDLIGGKKGERERYVKNKRGDHWSSLTTVHKIQL